MPGAAFVVSGGAAIPRGDQASETGERIVQISERRVQAFAVGHGHDGGASEPMKILSSLAAVVAALPLAALAQQSVPESPAIWREVTGVINTYPGGAGTTPVPVFTRPHMPAFRTSADGRIAVIVEGGGAIGSTPGFVLMMPEKMSVPFLLNPAGSYTMSSTTVTRINVTNSFGNTSLGTRNFTDGVKYPSHVCLWDAGSNPQV